MKKITNLSQHKAVKVVLDELFEKAKPKYHDDFAKIICLLSDCSFFETLFKEMSEDVEDLCEFYKNKLEIRGSFTEAIYDLFEIVGSYFPPVKHIVLVGGAARVFGAIVSNGLHFKDGTGPSHGEYTHMMQWLVIAYAKYYDYIRLDHDLRNLYSQTVGKDSFTEEEMLFVDPDDVGNGLVKGKIPYWQYMVDCFKEVGTEEDCKKNALSNSYRSPGFFMDQMLNGSLQGTYVGQRLLGRYNASKRKFITGKAQRAMMRKYHIKKQFIENGAFFTKNPGTNITLPDVPRNFLGDPIEISNFNEFKQAVSKSFRGTEFFAYKNDHVLKIDLTGKEKPERRGLNDFKDYLE